MKFTTFSHRNAAEALAANPHLSNLWIEIRDAISSVDDVEIIQEFESLKREAKSLSEPINRLIDSRLTSTGWHRQSRIFKDQTTYSGKTWTLDFSKATEDSSRSTGVAIEVVFNHAEAVAWNLTKLMIAAEQNHVHKETDIGFGVGVYICGTQSHLLAGGYDGAVGSYERVLKYLQPLSQILISPLMIVGLEAPDSFVIEHYTKPDNPSRVIGRIKKI